MGSPSASHMLASFLAHLKEMPTNADGVAIRPRRGNPNWGKPFIAVPNLPTKFELTVGELKLDPNDGESLARSSELKEWARRNFYSRYVPEFLLLAWNMTIDEDRL